MYSCTQACTASLVAHAGAHVVLMWCTSIWHTCLAGPARQRHCILPTQLGFSVRPAVLILQVTLACVMRLAAAIALGLVVWLIRNKRATLTRQQQQERFTALRSSEDPGGAPGLMMTDVEHGLLQQQR